MRNAAWMTAATLIFGCAQSGPAGDPLVDVAAPLPPQTPADAGAAGAGPCDPSIAAGEGVGIVDTGACPGVIPAAASCAAEITICSGIRAGIDGLQGDSASAASSDGRGSVVLSCRRADVGPPQDNYLFVPKPSGFVSKALLGVDARPLVDGFISSRGSVLLPPPEYDFLAHDGDLRSAQRGGVLYAGPGGAVILRLDGGQLIAQSFGADGTLRATSTVGAFAGSAGNLMVAGSMTTKGATLIVWQGYGEADAAARWLAPDGTLATGTFPIAGWTESAPFTAALSGGTVAVAAQPPSGATSRNWRGVIAAGDTSEQPAPPWLASRGDFRVLPGGKAMAFGSEIVGADGTVCGTVDLGAPLVGIGVDGTAFAARSERTFRIYPQLFR
jgi:hypothetical protein